MRRYDREKPVPGWELRNKRGPGADHPEYRDSQLAELRAQGEQLTHSRRALIADIEEARQAGHSTKNLEERLEEQEQQYDIIERKIKKFYGGGPLQ